MAQLKISGQPQWLVTTITDGIKRTEQIGANDPEKLRKSLTGSCDRVMIVPVDEIKRRK